MKAKIVKKEKTFKPVDVVVTFDSQLELDAITEVFGCMSQVSIERFVNQLMKDEPIRDDLSAKEMTTAFDALVNCMYSTINQLGEQK